MGIEHNIVRLIAETDAAMMACMQQPSSCQNKAHMGEFACTDRSQCWEPCGELGKSAEHARVVEEPRMCSDCRAKMARGESVVCGCILAAPRIT